MPKLRMKGATEVRNQLARLLAEAAKGHATIITRRGRPIAALVPLESIRRSLQQALTPLAGSGKGMWGANSTRAVRRLRDEWRGKVLS